MDLTLDQGVDLVSYARSVIEGNYSGSKPSIPDSLRDVFAEKRGVFVTITRYPGHELRGCIGYPEPTLPLGVAVERASLSAALEDPRFPAVDESEMDSLLLEVSVLTKPEIVKVEDPRQYVEKVVVCRDGLIAEKGWSRGLLLPQVPVEWGWDSEEFLCHTCVKAGLQPTAWLDDGFKLYSFQAQIFSEESPRGTVVEKEI
ncbi:MAG: TIGR00296 family protein [Candidatus Altiarchaeota archaeon]